MFAVIPAATGRGTYLTRDNGNYEVGAYGIEWVQNGEPERSRVKNVGEMCFIPMNVHNELFNQSWCSSTQMATPFRL